MKRAILTALCMLLAPALALAAGFTANLTGEAGSGLAVITIDGTTIEYNILVSGLSNPSTATLSDGVTTVDLAPAFVGGSAFGSVTSEDAPDVAADPAAWTVTVGNGSSTLSGALAGASAGVVLYHPVIANITGLAGTNFVTDVRVLNRSGATANVTIDFYQEGPAGHAAPTASTTVAVAANEQLVVNDVLDTVFGITGTKGGVILTSDRAITAGARIYNDQTGAGLGTFGQYQPGLPLSHGWASGAVVFLSNDDAGTGAGYRANLGWFNPNSAAVGVTFRGWDADGTLLGELTATANPYEMQQFNIGQLWPALATYGDLYITYSTAEGENLFVYGSVVDNVNGDAIYVAATLDN